MKLSQRLLYHRLLQADLRQHGECLEVPNFHSVNIGIRRQIRVVDNRQPIRGEAWMRVRVLIIECAAMVSQDARSHISLTIPPK